MQLDRQELRTVVALYPFSIHLLAMATLPVTEGFYNSSSPLELPIVVLSRQEDVLICHFLYLLL